jgi:hypothetical protein
VQDGVRRLPLIRAMIANSMLLSALYLGLGALVELLRRLYPLRWAERISLAMDALPARGLEYLGLLRYLRQLYAQGRLSEFWLRFTFGIAAVLIIFALGFVVGGLMWLFRRAMGAR